MIKWNRELQNLKNKDANLINNMDAFSLCSNTTNNSGYATLNTNFSDRDSLEGIFK